MLAEQRVADEFEAQLIAFIRAFGLHHGDRTPCGQPISVSEAHALTELATHGPLTQKQLVDRLHLEKSTISRLAEALEKRGWIARQPHATDRRALTLHLTDAGRRIAQKVQSARRAKFERLLLAVPDYQRPNVLAALSALVEALDHAEQPA